MSSSTYKKISVRDAGYPSLLKEIHKPPETLFYRGDISVLEKPLVAVVGSRKVSTYGQQVTEKITTELVLAGIGIVSGLAIGIDTIAHKTALTANGITVAVLGSGIDHIYPAVNRALAEDIVKGGGLIISEFPLGTPALPYHFPIRNRTIAGISLGVVVTEAREKSGALITAGHSLEQNREVFAVPGPIDHPGAVGPHQLIKQGAVLTTNGHDILTELQLEQRQQQLQIKQVLPATPTEARLLTFLETEALHVDKLSRFARLDINVVNATLTVLEMKGMVIHLGGQTYAKRS